MNRAVAVVALLCCLVAGAIGHGDDDTEPRCFHDDNADNFRVNNRISVLRRSEKARDGNEGSPFRIKLVYDDSIESRPDKDFIKQTYVEPARQFWTSALKVKYPLTSKILKSRACRKSWTTLDRNNETRTFCIGQCLNTTTCSGFVFPEEYLAKCEYCESEDLSTCTSYGEDGKGIDDADLVIFVLSANVSSCPSAAAYANTCEQESSYFRSVVAVINICPPQLYGGYDPYAMRGLLKHEMMHTLGMSKSSYAFYVDEQGKRYAATNPSNGLPYVNPETKLYQWSNQVIVQKELPWETPAGISYINRTFMVTPLVRDTVRNHFNCEDMEGAELENQGGSGTQWSHLEKRIFGAENIGGVRTESQNVSVVSLAIMQSTGWYIANFSAAEIYYWGQGLGCDFVNKSCYAYVRDQRAANRETAPFCDIMSRRTSNSWWQTTCDLTRNYPAECNLRLLSIQLPQEYRYFTDTVINGSPNDDPTYYAGNIELADYCPYLRQVYVPSPIAHHNRYKRCKDPSVGLPPELDPSLEKYGVAMCVRQASPFISYVAGKDPSTGNKTLTWGSGCYEVQCGANVTIVIQGVQLTCRRELETVGFDVSAYADVRTRGEFVCPLCEHACPNAPCSMQPYHVSLLDTHDRSKATTDPLGPAVVYVPTTSDGSKSQESPVTTDNSAAIIGLGVATGVLGLSTLGFGVLYFMARSASKNAVKPV